MWQDEVLPRLAARGVGADSDVRTLRLTGVGESVVAEQLGDAILRATNPVVATYARQEAVDIRISARAADGRTAASLADDAEASVVAILGEYVWARGDTTWAGALEAALAERGWTLATTEHGTDGALVQLLRSLPAVVLAERRSDAAGAADALEEGVGHVEVREAGRVRVASGADVGLAIRALRRRRGHDGARRDRDPRWDTRRAPVRVPAREPGRRPGGDRGRGGAARAPAGRPTELRPPPPLFLAAPSGVVCHTLRSPIPAVREAASRSARPRNRH